MKRIRELGKTSEASGKGLSKVHLGTNVKIISNIGKISLTGVMKGATLVTLEGRRRNLQ